MTDFGKLVFLPLDISTPPDISAYLDTIDKNHEAYIKTIIELAQVLFL